MAESDRITGARFVAHILRSLSGYSQSKLGRLLGVDASVVSAYEKGELVPTEETLRQMAAAAGVSVPAANQLRRGLDAFADALNHARQEGDESWDARPLEQALVDTVRLAITPFLLEEEQAFREWQERWGLGERGGEN